MREIFEELRSDEHRASSKTIRREVGCDKIKGMSLTQVQKDILVGSILGDGSLEFNGYHGARLQIKQSEAKGEYVNWLFKKFENLVRTAPKQRSDTNQWYFGTRYFKELKEFRDIFYQNGRKSIPKNISKFIRSPLTLSVWFMDDGSLDYREKSHFSFSLSTDSFSFNEVELLKAVLLKQFNIVSSIQTPSSRGKKYVKLYIGKHGRENFLKAIRPYVLKCFSYKLPPHTA
jgi:intein-encoded DNA endonuclease-like protein